MCHQARSDLRVDGVEARTSKASQWAASYVKPPAAMPDRFCVGGLVALGLGVGLFFVTFIAYVVLDVRGWPDDAIVPILILLGGGIMTILGSLACGAGEGGRCELACYGEGDKELACVNTKGELVSHLDGKALTPAEAVKLGWWIVDTFSDITPPNVGLPHSVGRAPSPQGVAGQTL